MQPIIFRSYIGMKPYPETLNEYPGQIINEHVEQFHFIVGFAKETLKGEYGTGKFRVMWNLEFFGRDKVLSLKTHYPGAKVILSIGGNDHAFNPRDKDEWVNHAVETIKKILEDDYKVCGSYIIDGIDINYLFINPKHEPQDFSYCIGSVIKQLKDVMPLVSIAPSDAPSDSVQRYYKQLYSDYQQYIDWVCYQFYHQKVETANNFVELYGGIVDDYAHGVVLAGGSSDPANKDNIPQSIFLDGCKELISQGNLPGIFVWNANDSDIHHNNEQPFVLESTAQELFLPPN